MIFHLFHLFKAHCQKDLTNKQCNQHNSVDMKTQYKLNKAESWVSSISSDATQNILDTPFISLYTHILNLTCLAQNLIFQLFISYSYNSGQDTKILDSSLYARTFDDIQLHCSTLPSESINTIEACMSKDVKDWMMQKKLKLSNIKWVISSSLLSFHFSAEFLMSSTRNASQQREQKFCVCGIVEKNCFSSCRASMSNSLSKVSYPQFQD